MADKKEEAAEAPAGGKKKLIIIIVAAVVIIGGGVGAFLAMGSSDKHAEGEAGLEEGGEGEHGGGHGEGGEGVVLPPAVLPLETFIVNLQVKGSFLRTTIQLEFAEPELPHTVENDVPKIKDSVIRVLSGKSSSELLTIEGKDKVRTEIRDAINEVLGGEEVTQIYFTEFIIQ